MTDYRTLKTNRGLALEVAAETGGDAITLTTLVVGDGGGESVLPDARQETLVREVTRLPLNTVTQQPNDATQWVAEAIIPPDNGGYTVREVGLLTKSGELFAVGNFPNIYKPRPDEGTAGQLIITMSFQAKNSDNVTLVIDGNSAVATRQWVEETVSQAVSDEHQRATQAESGFVSGALELAEGDHQGTGLHTRGSDQAVLYKDTSNGWRPLALQADLQAETQRAESALVDEVQARQEAQRQLVSGNGFTDRDLGVTHAYVGDSGTVPAVLDRNGTPWRLATRDNLAAETQRAQSAENTKVNRSGDTMSGPLSVTDGNGNGLTLGAGTLTNAAGKTWRPNVDGSLTAPGGGVLPEVLGIGGRLVAQLFRIQNLANVQTIQFPRAFNATDPVNQIFITLGNSYNLSGATDNEGSVPFIYKLQTTNTGFRLDRSGSGFGRAAFDVVAYGPM